MFVVRPPSKVPHGGRRAGGGSVQPQVPLLPEQESWNQVAVLVHCKSSDFVLVRACFRCVHVLT